MIHLLTLAFMGVHMEPLKGSAILRTLTEREHDCLYWAAQGKTSWEIGRILGISERTANFHIANICDKFNVRTRQAAITAAIRLELLSPPRQSSAATARNRPPARVPGRRVRQSPRPPATRRPSL